MPADLTRHEGAVDQESRLYLVVRLFKLPENQSGSGEDTPPKNEIKLKEERAPKGLFVDIVRGAGVLSLFPSFIPFVFRYDHISKDVRDFEPHDIPEAFIGINIAPGPDEAFDDYILERLKELGVLHVRIDYGYTTASEEHAGRLIPKLHAEGCRILLHLVQPVKEAWRVRDKKVMRRWEEFVEGALNRFDGMIEAVELAATPNRFSWAGYTIRGFVAAVAAGAAICERRGIPWYGPNVSDFSPAFNVGILQRLKRAGKLPSVHTNNLFVDRAGQPENNDTKVSEHFSRKMNFDLVGKAQILHTISRYFSINKTISTYNYWTLNTKSGIKPRYVSEEQFARYLVRYGVLAAASGHLDRVYWGQMVSYTKGLISDETGLMPRIPVVHHLWRLHGELDEYIIRPGFHALAALVRELENCRFVARLDTDDNTFAFEFEKIQDIDKADVNSPGRFIVAWTRDHLTYNLKPWFVGSDDSADKKIVSIRDMYGKEIEARDLTIKMEPVFIEYEGPSVAKNHSEKDYGYLGRVPVPANAKHPYRLFNNGKYRGVMREDILTEEVQAALENPESLARGRDDVRVVKDSERNFLAELPLSTHQGDRKFFFKAFKKKKLLSDTKRSRSYKAWDNICKILYRDINTPHPVAMIENVEDPTGNISYLIVESAENTYSLREILEYIRKGKAIPFEGGDSDEFLRQFGIFSRVMHRSGIYHRDYSGGNVLVNKEMQDGQFDFTLMDIARVRFYRRVKYPRCFLDLSRVRLGMKDRKTFFDAYIEVEEFPERAKYWWGYRAVHFYYRSKYNLKKPKRLLKLFRK